MKKACVPLCGYIKQIGFYKILNKMSKVLFLITLMVIILTPAAIAKFSFFNISKDITCPSKIAKIKINPIISWIWNQRNNNKCIQIIIDTNPTTTYNQLPPCFYDILIDHNYSVKTIDFSHIIKRNIFAKNRTNCEMFLVLSTDKLAIRHMFDWRQKNAKRFFPFSQIFLLTNEDFQQSVVRQSELIYINRNALNVYTLKNNLFNDVRREFNITRITNVLTNKSRNLPVQHRKQLVNYHGNYRSHPFFNETNRKHCPFRVSMFNCPPYVIDIGIEQNLSNNELLLSGSKYDGLEWRFVYEMTQNWNVKFTESKNSKLDVWYITVNSVEKNDSDLAMCSVWMTVNHNAKFDLSAYFDHQCITFLVPKPMALNEALNIYLTFNSEVWIFIVLSVIGFALILSGISKLRSFWFKSHADARHQDNRCIDLTASLMNAINMATAHGIAHFPRQHTIKILLTRFFVFFFY